MHIPSRVGVQNPDIFYSNVYMYVYKHVCMYVYMHVCMYVCQDQCRHPGGMPDHLHIPWKDVSGEACFLEIYFTIDIAPKKYDVFPEKYVSLSLCLPICLSVCVSVCLSVCMYVCMYVNVYVYMYDVGLRNTKQIGYSKEAMADSRL